MEKIKKIGFTIFGVFAFIFVLLIVMAIFNLCPPIESGPQPPWCEEGASMPPFFEALFTRSQKSLVIEDAIIIPTNINEINYPLFYNAIETQKYEIENPFCTIQSDNAVYPKDYIGEYEFPEVIGAPLDENIKRAVGVKDHWVRDPNLNRCFFIGNKMMDSFKKTLSRVNDLGADQIHITNYIHFKDFSLASLDPNDVAISDNILKQKIEIADNKGLDVILYLNVAPGGIELGPIPHEDWLNDFIDSYETFLLNQARIAQETGIKAIMLNHFDYQPSITGYEKVYNKKMSALLNNVREIFDGEVILLVEPLLGADLDELDDLLYNVDSFLFTPITTPLAYSEDKTISVTNLENLYTKDLKRWNDLFGMYNKPFYIRILIQSEKEFLVQGWDEDSSCIKKGEDSCYQLNLNPDFSVQAIAYESLLRSLNYAQNNMFEIAAIDTYGYWYTDVLLGNYSHPQIAQSVRNKPAESIVMEWFKLDS